MVLRVRITLERQASGQSLRSSYEQNGKLLEEEVVRKLSCKNQNQDTQ